MRITIRQLRRLIKEQLITESDSTCAQHLKNPEKVVGLLDDIEGILFVRHSYDHSMVEAVFLDKDTEPSVSRYSRDRGHYDDPVSWDKVFSYDVPDINGYPASLDKPGVRPFTKLEVRQKIKNALGCDPVNIGSSHSHGYLNITAGDLILPYLTWSFDYSEMEERY